jgi:hypothetical protein
MNVKENWTDTDFEVMSWYDSYIHSMSFPGENSKMSFSIDYLFKWILAKEENLFHFWISPCILVFNDVLNSKINFDFQNTVGLQINVINRTNQVVSERQRISMGF